MKTRKQVLAEFQRMHRQLCGKVSGFCEVREYNDTKGWSVEISVYKFVNMRIAERSEVKWRNFRDLHDESIEAENEARLAEFKKKFNLK